MKQLIFSILSVLLFFSCSKDYNPDRPDAIDYDFSVLFSSPEKKALTSSWDLSVTIKNKSIKNVDNLKMKVSFPPNLSIRYNGIKVQNNYLYDVDFVNIENIALDLRQEIASVDTIRFRFSNSFYSKDVTFVVPEKFAEGYVKFGKYDYGKAIGNNKYKGGDTVRLSAVPNIGSRFVGWYDEKLSTLLSHSAKYSFVFEKDIKITPKFERISGMVMFGDLKNGEAFGDGKYFYGDLVKAVAKPHNGYHFAYWRQLSKPKSKKERKSFIKERKSFLFSFFKSFVSNKHIYYFKFTEDVTIVPIFKPNTGYVKIVKTGRGTKGCFRLISGGDRAYKIGERVELDAVVSDDWLMFRGWYKNGVRVSRSSKYSFICEGDVELVPQCTLSPHFHRW